MEVGTVLMIEKISPNLFRIEIPLPGIVLEIINVYLVKSLKRNLLIDTGLNHPESLEAILQAFELLDVDLKATDIFITHFHVDHAGLAFSLATENTTVFAGLPDTDKILNGLNWDDMFSFASLHGFPRHMMPEVKSNHPEFVFEPSQKPRLTTVGAEGTITVGEQVYKCIHTPGHTKGHLCLYEGTSRLFFSGDHILQGITPNIQLWSHHNDPLGDFLASLNRVYHMDIELVLPGHRAVFRDYREVIQALKKHHRERAAEILSILQKGNGNNSFQIASEMKWDVPYHSWDQFPAFDKWLATGEVIAHLEYLERHGLVEARPGPDQPYAYRIVGSRNLSMSAGILKKESQINEEYEFRWPI